MERIRYFTFITLLISVGVRAQYWGYRNPNPYDQEEQCGPDISLQQRVPGSEERSQSALKDTLLPLTGEKNAPPPPNNRRVRPPIRPVVVLPLPPRRTEGRYYAQIPNANGQIRRSKRYATGFLNRFRLYDNHLLVF